MSSSVERIMSRGNCCFVCAQDLGSDNLRLVTKTGTVWICNECRADYALQHEEPIEATNSRGANPLELLRPRVLQ
jgi:hypothetical protein